MKEEWQDLDTPLKLEETKTEMVEDTTGAEETLWDENPWTHLTLL